MRRMSYIPLRPILLFAVLSALYFLSRSSVLDEWDSVQFALGTREFNLWKHQPHPPGYPLYIFFGWIGNNLCKCGPELSLHLLSATSGALFVTTWFCIARHRFGEQVAWLVAGSLAVTPIVWMTSAQVLTDMPAAGVLSAELLCALLYLAKGTKRNLFVAALLGAAAAGIRPQLIGIVVVILLTPLLARRAPARLWLAANGVLVVGCLIWLVPTCYLQARVTPNLPNWLAYAAQLYNQWQWRLDKPHAFIGASDFSPQYFGVRFATHILGWFGVGFGFIKNPYALIVGTMLTLLGLISYFRNVPSEDRAWWKSQLSWVSLHIAIIFCCLPANQRYYLMIMPLLLIAMHRGFLQLPARWRWTRFALAALLLSISLPLAIENHRDEPPPMKLIRYLQEHHPINERHDVVLFVKECERHVQWYAPEFTAFYDFNFPMTKVDLEQLQKAKAIYTDDRALTLRPGWKLVAVAEFHRSLLIELKQRNVSLYRVEPTSAL